MFVCTPPWQTVLHPSRDSTPWRIRSRMHIAPTRVTLHCIYNINAWVKISEHPHYVPLPPVLTNCWNTWFVSVDAYYEDFRAPTVCPAALQVHTLNKWVLSVSMCTSYYFTRFLTNYSFCTQLINCLRMFFRIFPFCKFLKFSRIQQRRLSSNQLQFE